MLAVDVFPCEDGHAQERSLFDQVLPTVEEDDVWIAGKKNFYFQAPHVENHESAFALFAGDTSAHSAITGRNTPCLNCTTKHTP